MKQRAEFDLALRASCSANKWYAVCLRKNKYGFARLGVIVSKKIIPKATARNFVKRMIREIFRCNFSVDFPLDVVVRAKRQAPFETLAESRLALITLFQSVPK